MSYKVTHIHRYPVKGLSPDEMQTAELTEGEPLPFDRAFALALSTTQFDRSNPEWLPKQKFLMLQRDEKLAALDTAFTPEKASLAILRSGKQVAHGSLKSPIGRALLEDFFSAYMGKDIAGKPKIVEAPEGHMFSDTKPKVLSFINLASVRDLERVSGIKINPIRFRGNVIFDSDQPWVEFSWLDKTLAFGSAELQVTARIDRCAAINVNVENGKRDANLVKDLQRAFRHIDMGVYAHVTRGGTISVGDELTLN